MTDLDRKKYNMLTPYLEEINRKFITISSHEERINNAILRELLLVFLKHMTTVDRLFDMMFNRVFFGGSYYDGLKVGAPDEYDLDLLLNIPKYCYPTITHSSVPGYVHIQIKIIPEGKTYTQLEDLMDNNRYVDTDKVRIWMKSVVYRALNMIPNRILQTSCGPLWIGISESGPAMTLRLRGEQNKSLRLDIDLVPAFHFGPEKWASLNGFRQNPVPIKPTFFLIPKQPKEVRHDSKIGRFWRLSFQEQERLLLDGKNNLKNSIRLLKKLRSNLQHDCIASYFIKTVALWSCENQLRAAPFYWNDNLGFSFMTLLKEYQRCIENGKIEYYFKKNYNLLGNIRQERLVNISNCLKNVIGQIDRCLVCGLSPELIINRLLSDKEELTYESYSYEPTAVAMRPPESGWSCLIQ